MNEKGLGTRSLKVFNCACLAKLAMEFLKNKKEWCKFLRSRFYKSSTPITYNCCSSVWSAIKWGLQTIEGDTRWIIGRNSSLSLRYYNWVNGESLQSKMGIPQNLLPQNHSLYRLCCEMVNGYCHRNSGLLLTISGMKFSNSQYRIEKRMS